MKTDSQLHSSETANAVTEFIPEDNVTVVIDSEQLDYTKEYSDEFYEEYIERFQKSKKKKLFYRFVKRSFDIFASLLGLILLSPLFLIIAILIKCDSKGKVIFTHDRVGKDGKTFKCHKFRSIDRKSVV